MSELEKFVHKNRHYRINDGSGRVSTLDKYKRYYIASPKDKIELTPSDHQRLERLKAAYAMMIKHNPVMKKREVMHALQKIYGMSYRQTMRDINDAQELFGDVDKAHKEFERVKYTSWLNDIVSLCFAKMDLKTAVEAIKQLVTINELNVKDELLNDETPKTYNLNILVNTAEGPKVIRQDIDKLDQLSFSEFEVITANVDQPRVGITEMEKMLKDHQDGFEESDVE